MEAEKTNQEEHFNPYTKIEVIESERRLERQIHELEVKFLNQLNSTQWKILLGLGGYFTTLLTLLVVYLEIKFK